MADTGMEVREKSSSYANDKIPASLSELCEQLKVKISQKSQLYSISYEDQQVLTAVLTGELGLIWQDLKTPSINTTLTHEENMQVHCRTFSEVLRICEQLILHYLLLMDSYRRSGVYTDQSRLVTQLASDCTNLLNVKSIRSRIVSGIKAASKVKSGAVTSEEEQRNMLTMPNKHVKNCMSSTQWEQRLSDDLKENIREMDLQCVYDLLPLHKEAIPFKTDAKCSSDRMASVKKQGKDQKRFGRIKGCHSMPDLYRDTLLKELEISPLSRSSSMLVLLSTETTVINPREDLERLLKESYYDDDIISDTDFLPLIKAHSNYDSRRLQKLKQKLQKIEEEDEKKKKHKAPGGAGDKMVASTQTIVHMATARVSERVLLENIKLSMYPPVFNDLTKEIDSASLAEMNKDMVEEKVDMKRVYEELSKSISTKYFNFDESPIEPIPTASCLRRSYNKNLFNPSLIRPNPYSISHRERMERASNQKKPVDETTREYRAWFNWWKCQLSLDDYLLYISNQDSDYLSVLLHLYDSEDEEEEKRKLAQKQKKERRRKQQEKRNSLRKMKEEYVPGFWNVNTIQMGGLGKDPALEEKNPDERMQNASEAESVCFGEVNESPTAGLLVAEQVQTRLERVWNALCVPEGQRLDMAIKYSTHEYRDHLWEAIAAWEQAAQMIQQRELLLSRLEDFEREASDPCRFFKQGYQGSSVARMEEASRREKLSSQISVVGKELSKTIGHITNRFNDTITYKGRPYKDKMRWDRIEMLYWLQQERRVQSLERFAQGQTVLPVRLPPLKHNQELYSFNHETMQDCIQF